MQELEKILEEIKAHRNFASECGNFNVASAFELCVEIIRKHMNDGWIPVEKELPPNAKDESAFCPKYQVMTMYGVTEGWYNPRVKGWYVLSWFMTERYLDSEVDFVRGDKPKIVLLPDEVNNKKHILTAWKPIEPSGKER